MLVKCVCSNCGHSYLGDDSAGELSCPRCDVSNEYSRNASDIPDGPGPDLGIMGALGAEDDGGGYGGPTRFAPQAPPPMFITSERLIRGLVFGSVACVVIGGVVGAALTSLSFVLPLVGPVVIALMAGLTCRYGFGGPCAAQTKGRALVAVSLSVLIGIGGFFGGAWTIARLTSGRAEQTRADLDDGLRGLVSQRARANDAGTAIVLDHRIAQVEKLKARSDPQLEDYLWMQQAKINQPLIAYTKLRTTDGPLVQLGVDRDPVVVQRSITASAVLVEILIAISIAMWAVKGR